MLPTFHQTIDRCMARLSARRAEMTAQQYNAEMRALEAQIRQYLTAVAIQEGRVVPEKPTAR
jgi:hypothetical protein